VFHYSSKNRAVFSPRSSRYERRAAPDLFPGMSYGSEA